MMRYIIVSIVSGILFGVLDGVQCVCRDSALYPLCRIGRNAHTRCPVWADSEACDVST